MRPDVIEQVEIFRFEYHVVERPPRRSRVILTDTDDLLRLTETKESDGWTVSDFQEIEYFEYSDEDLNANKTHLE